MNLSDRTIWTEEFQYLSNRDAATFSALPKVTRAELAAAGRISGYMGGYWNGCGGLCDPGLLDIRTEVHAFGSARQASRFLAHQVTLYRELEGKKLSDVATFDFVELFDAGDIGQEAIGIRDRVSIPTENTTLNETVIMFRIDAIVGLSSTNRERQKNSGAQALALARLLERRVAVILEARRH